MRDRQPGGKGIEMDFSGWIVKIPVLLFAVTIHEYSHGRAALSLGDPTARNAGRLTLNPLPHIDP
ncbi:MAG: site-2 protease family protein, partial [Desulfobacteraceae bacterium]